MCFCIRTPFSPPYVYVCLLLKKKKKKLCLLLTKFKAYLFMLLKLKGLEFKIIKDWNKAAIAKHV